MNPPIHLSRPPATATARYPVSRRLKWWLLLFLPLLLRPQVPSDVNPPGEKKDIILYKNSDWYAAFPRIARDEQGALWVRLGWNTTGSHYRGADEDQRGLVTLRAADVEGPWQEVSATPPPELDYNRVRLSDRTVIQVHHHGWEIISSDVASRLAERGILTRKGQDGLTRALWRLSIMRRAPGEKEYSGKILEVPSPRSSVHGFGKLLVLPDDTILKPVYGHATPESDVTGAWVMRSTDGGQSWEFITVAEDGIQTFDEISLIRLPGDEILAVIRACTWGCTTPDTQDSGFLWQSFSQDGGKTWSQPERTGMWGYPGTLLILNDGILLCSYGYRRPPYGIRACFSYDNGRTWDTKNEVILRADGLTGESPQQKGAPHDLGYPWTIELPDGRLFTVYYITTGGITHITGSLWDRGYRGPADLPRGVAALYPLDSKTEQDGKQKQQN